MRRSGLICSAIIALWATEGLTQRVTVISGEGLVRQGPVEVPDPITEDEIAMVREAIGIGVGGGFLESQVLSFRSWRRYAEDGVFTLEGALWETPVWAQGRLCVLVSHGVVGESDGSEYLWSRKLFQSTANWTAGTEEECEVDDPLQFSPPQFADAVWTDDIIPTDAMIQIVEGADRLVQAMLAHPAAEIRRLEGLNWRLTRVSLATSLRRGIGIAYHASFDAGVGHGPFITFTVTDGVFVVHSIGSWIA